MPTQHHHHSTTTTNKPTATIKQTHRTPQNKPATTNHKSNPCHRNSRRSNHKSSLNTETIHWSQPCGILVATWERLSMREAEREMEWKVKWGLNRLAWDFWTHKHLRTLEISNGASFEIWFERLTKLHLRGTWTDCEGMREQKQREGTVALLKYIIYWMA